MDKELEQLLLSDDVRSNIPLGFRVIYYKAIPEGVSRELNLRNRRFESLEVSCAPCAKPISKLGFSKVRVE